jgi:aryl-alcohol dehydrogenase-like predicted oxidoreductase
VEYRRLGRSGLLVSAVGLGTNNFGTRLDEAGTRRVLDQALELGITFVDTADSYGRGASEALIGKLLGPRRKDVVLATKFSSPMGDSPYQRGTSRRWLIEALDASLRRLATDAIDLYQIHFPDPETPIEETLRALDDVVAAGKVRYVGYSNFAAWQIVEGQWTARSEHLVRPISTQNHYNLLRREVEAEVLPAARAHGLGVIPYFPLESGFLTGKYRPGKTPQGARLEGSARAGEVLRPANFERLERWEAFASSRGRSLVELAVGWLLSHPEVGSVIAGASSAEQVRANVEAGTWRLEAAEMEMVAATE